MILSFNFGLYPQEELRWLSPHLVPIMDGLAEAGHRVERFVMGVKTPPAVNVLVYHRAVGAAPLQEVTELKRKHPEVRVGILALGPVSDSGEPSPTDQAGLAALAEAADFAWTILPPENLPELAAASGKIARLRYGFSERALGPNARPEASRLRDIDVTFRGPATPRRQAVWNTLTERGAACFWMDNVGLPPYIADDLVSRSKVVLDFIPEATARSRSPALSAQALHQGTVIVSETAEAGWQTDFDGFAIVTPYEALADRCVQLLQSGLYTQLGLAALQKFRSETSMRANMEAAMGLPAFRSFAAS
jgi:hypothetical protein